VCGVQGGPEATSERGWVTDRPEVHVEQARLLVGEMAVQGHDVNTVVFQGADHWIDLVGGHGEVAVDTVATLLPSRGWNIPTLVRNAAVPRRRLLDLARAGRAAKATALRRQAGTKRWARVAATVAYLQG
jgi:hypothetical protein